MSPTPGSGVTLTPHCEEDRAVGPSASSTMSVLSKVLNGAGSPTQPTGLFVAAGLFVGTLGQVTAWLGMRSLGTLCPHSCGRGLGPGSSCCGPS